MSWGQHPTRKLLHTLLSLNFIAKEDSPKTEKLLTFVVVGSFLYFTISRCSHELIEHCSHLVMSRHFTEHCLTLYNRFSCDLSLLLMIIFMLTRSENLYRKLSFRLVWVAKSVCFSKNFKLSYYRYRKKENWRIFYTFILLKTTRFTLKSFKSNKWIKNCNSFKFFPKKIIKPINWKIQLNRTFELDFSTWLGSK